MTSAHVIAFVLIILIIVFFLCLGKWSNLLRDSIDDPAAFMACVPAKYKGKTIDQIPHPFSLARTQLAMWTTIIACSYVYLYFSVGCDAMTINKTALILMGVSVATTAAGSIIDKSQSQANAAASAGTDSPPAQARHQNCSSDGLITDMISDGDGVNIHRFQNVVWTVISMTIYVYAVVQTTKNSCALPTLDDTLLAISGISNATYVGLKINENK